MTNEKWVLIVDDEEAILSVLQKSLHKLGGGYHVVTASDGYAALNQLQEHPFDLVVTDYKMAGINGLELLETIHQLQPTARVILMTAYGNDALETEARRLQAYRYLAKPLEIDAFREIVKDALGQVAVSRPGILILSDERYRQVVAHISQLQADIGARCVFLTDPEGHFIARTGDMGKMHLEQIAALVGGSVATLLEAGRLIDGDVDTINLSYREGKQDNLYVINIGSRLLLIVVIERGPYSSRLGSVWYYAQQTAQILREKLGEDEHAVPQQMFAGDLGQEMDDEMDRLFELPDKPATPAPAAKTPPPSRGQPQVPNSDGLSTSPVMSYEEALARGLIDHQTLTRNQT